MSISLPSAKKNIAVIGNPGVGKTTFLIALIHHMSKIGWAEIDFDTLPPDYAAATDSLVSGQPLFPTVGLKGYLFKFQNFTYRGSEVKAGWFGNIDIRVTDLSGDDYRYSSAIFRQSIENSFALLILIDPIQSDTLPHSLAGQVAPLHNAIQYILDSDQDVKHIELVFTKHYLHTYSYEEMVEFVNEQLGPILNIARRKQIDISMFEIDSRGKAGRLDPVGIEPVIYKALCYGCKVKGVMADVEGSLHEE